MPVLATFELLRVLDRLEFPFLGGLKPSATFFGNLMFGVVAATFRSPHTNA
jgi:hypothetical protein